MELKDLLAYTGIEADSIETFKEQFKTKFIPASDYVDPEKVKGDTTGRITGAFQTKTKSLFGLEPEEVKGKPWEEVLELAHTKTKARIEELTELSSKSSDGALKELNEKLERSNKLASEYKEALAQAQADKEATVAEFSGKFKEHKIGWVVKEAYDKVRPKLSTLTKAEEFYIDNLIKENVKIDFDDQEQPIVYNKEGKRWTDPNRAGSFLTPDQVIEQIAIQENFIKKNNAGDSGKKIFTGGANNGNQQQPTERALHPSAIKAAESKA